MKKLLLVLIAVILSGCAGAGPNKTNLNPELAEQPAGVYPPGILITVEGKDNRPQKQVVIYTVYNEPAILVNQVAPHVLMAERLADGFTQQGLLRGGQTPVVVTIAVEELLVTVGRTKSGLLYKSNAKSRIKLTINNRGTVLTKDYNRQESKETATKPSIGDLEKMLNIQLSDVLQRILGDGQVRESIRGDN